MSETPKTAGELTVNSVEQEGAASATPATVSESAGAKTPTVYFIDDSATMREVVKIAFRRESMNVITCNDAASALAQFEQAPPDAIITDVIMPDKDGYEVCHTIKQNPKLRETPVILMSGVVNRTVAEKAISVQADELIRKPFQPQELIARVKNLLQGKSGGAPEKAAANSAGSGIAAKSVSSAPQDAAQALSGIFSAPLLPPTAAPAQEALRAPAQRKHAPVRAEAATAPSRAAINGAPADVQKLRSEIQRLTLLVKKLQSELQAERQYSASLEEHLKTLQEAE